MHWEFMGPGKKRVSKAEVLSRPRLPNSKSVRVDFDVDHGVELNAAESVPEYIEVDVAVDSGAGDNVLSRVDAPGHEVQESLGS